MVAIYASSEARKSAVTFKRLTTLCALLAAWSLVIFLIIAHAYLTVTASGW